MEKKKIGYFDLFRSLFIISLVTFGGGYTIIPIIKDEFVTRKKVISEDEMIKIITLSQSLPGVMTISTSFLTGYTLLGVFGAIIATIASTLPCIMIISLIAFSYNKLIENIYIQRALNGVSGAVIALLLITVFSMLRKGISDKHKYFYVIIFLVSLELKYVHNLDIIYIIILTGITSFLYYRGEKND